MIALMFIAVAGIYVVIGGLILKRISSKWLKGLVVVIWILIPTGDEIAGHLYFNHLCSTEAGVKVYQTVELPAEYWNAQGKPRFYVNPYGRNRLRYIFPNNTIIDAPQFEYTLEAKPYNKFFHIDKETIQISDREKGKLLGEYSLFRYWGGWLDTQIFSMVHNSAITCDANDLDSWPLNIFKPTTQSRKGNK